MKKLVVLSVLTFAWVTPLWTGRASTSAKDEAEIRQVLDRWAKAFRAKDVKGIMSVYAPGEGLVAFDIVPPLQYVGWEAYKKDYQDFLAQYRGPLDVEFREVRIAAGDRVAYSHGLERIRATMANGQKSEMWVRFTQCYRKIDGHWLATHDHISVPVDLESGKATLSLQP